MPNEQPGFTIRAVIIAILVSLFLLATTSYIALKLGIAPWPIVFSVIVTGGVLKLLSGTRAVNIHEINVAQAGASVGGLVAAGVVFTIPGIIFLTRTQGIDIAWPDPWRLGLATAAAGLLGVLLSVPLKRRFVDEDALPYPAGTAGAELLKLGKTGGEQLLVIVIVGCLAGIFAMVRDLYFPGGFAFNYLAVGIFIAVMPLPMMIGGGYILGPSASFSWLAGAAVGWLALVPILFTRGYDLDLARPWVQNLGMGLVLGAGIGFFLRYLLPRMRQIFLPVVQGQERHRRSLPLMTVLAAIILVVAGVPWPAALLTLLGVWMMVAVAARMTGETNIDPLEQFGIFIGLMVTLAFALFSTQLDMYAVFMIIMFVSVACAVAGDIGHDYKSSAIIGTRFLDIVKIDAITVVISGLAAPFVLEIFRTGFGEALFTEQMPAPQAQMVAGSVFGFSYPWVFATGLTLGLVGELAIRLSDGKLASRLMLMPFGIGLFLGPGLALPLALGAALRLLIDKRFPARYHAWLVVAAGVMGGEGIAGFSAGALTIAGLTTSASSMLLAGALALVLVASAFALLVHKKRAD